MNDVNLSWNDLTNTKSLSGSDEKEEDHHL